MYEQDVRHTTIALPDRRPVAPPVGVVTRGLGKRFGDMWALRDLDLDVAPGTVLGLLGHNGAGKTTAIRILTTLSSPTEGSATVAGLDVVTDPGAVRRRIGVAAQQATVDGLMDARANLEMVGRLHHLPKARARARADELLERLDLADAADAAGQELLGRHAPPARPGRQPRRGAPGAVPRRAHHRARPPQPQRPVGHPPRPGARRHHHHPHHPVPRRGRPAGRRHRRARPRPHRRPRQPRRAQGADRQRPGRRQGAVGQRARPRGRGRSSASPPARRRSTTTSSSSPCRSSRACRSCR